MRVIREDKIRKAVAFVCRKAGLFLRKDVLSALVSAYKKEKGQRAKRIIKSIIDNARIAQSENLAICQDTGLPIVFAELGRNAVIKGDLYRAINKGVEDGYSAACFRKSIVRNPLTRGIAGYLPAVTHLDMVRGDKIKITVLPKGFGCENKSALKMFNPTAPAGEIKKFIIETVKEAGPDACPPYIVGVGIGGTADYASLLAKKALLHKLRPSSIVHRPSGLRKLENDLLNAINKLNIGPMGLGGKTTALAVNILTYPTHIAGLPVAVNISCHALRSATALI